MEIIENALKEGRTALSEYESKVLLASYQIPVTREMLVGTSKELTSATHEIGYPVVIKACSPEISHKTEKGLIRIDIRNDDEAFQAYDDITAGMSGSKGAVLVQEMVKGKRELVI
jgi:acyl-CoA synthetase (NDP forming)